MDSEFRTKQFLCRIPSGWKISRQESSFALFRTVNGCGALNISCMVNNQADTPDLYELTNMLSDGRASNVRGFDHDDSHVSAVQGEYLDDSRYWYYWVLFRAPVAVFLSYNSRAGYMDPEELMQATQIVRSIKIL